MSKLSKNQKKSLEAFNAKEKYSIEQAISYVKKIAFEKFNTSITASFNLNLDTTKNEQQLRGTILFPHGTGKKVKVLAISNSDDQTKAKSGGADFVGGLELLEKIKKDNWFDFDFIVTTPNLMPEFAKYGKLLGPKGLMPNPKLGTVTTDLKGSIENIKKGQIEYKTDKEGIVNIIIGKKNFANEALVENYNSIFTLIKGKKPSTVKGEYIKSITISSTMGPGIKVINNK